MNGEMSPADARERRVVEAKFELFRAIAAKMLGDRELSSDLVLSKYALDFIVKELKLEACLTAYLSGYFNVKGN